jgi:hypothetical protein
MAQENKSNVAIIVYEKEKSERLVSKSIAEKKKLDSINAKS